MPSTHRVPMRRHTALQSGLAQKNPICIISPNPAGILQGTQSLRHHC